MTKKEYQEKLLNLIKTKGYWSSDVKALNDKCIESVGYITYLKWRKKIFK